MKTVGDKNITQESSAEPEARPHIRSYDNVYTNKCSDAPEHDPIPKLKLGVIHSTTESKPMEWKIKKQSVFGHATQLSTVEFQLPKLKKSEHMSAMKESDWSKDYCIKPRIKINKQRMASTETEESHGRKAIKMSDRMYATKESEYVDHDAIRLQMFKARNVHGHATDSTVEKLLYGGKTTEKKIVKKEGKQRMSFYFVVKKDL